MSHIRPANERTVTALLVFESVKEVARAAKQSATASTGMLESRRAARRNLLAPVRGVEPRLERRINVKDFVTIGRSNRKVRSDAQDTNDCATIDVPSGGNWSKIGAR